MYGPTTTHYHYHTNTATNPNHHHTPPPHQIKKKQPNNQLLICHSYDHLDKDLWRWVDNDPDARASSAFTNAGLIGSVNGRRSLLAVGIICFLGCFYFFATCDDTLCSWGIISVLYAATWTVVTNVLVWMHYPIHAMNFFSLGFLPFAAMYSVNAVCDCSCSAAHSAICWLHDDIRDNCVAGGLWPNATLDDTRGGGGGSGSSGVMGDAAGIQSWSKVMAGTCYSEIYVALGAFVMVVLFRLYPRCDKVARCLCSFCVCVFC